MESLKESEQEKTVIGLLNTDKNQITVYNQFELLRNT